MTLVSTYTAAVVLMCCSLLCLGSWANGFRLAKWRFELAYIDFAVGMLLVAVLLAFTAGSLGYDSFTFLDDVMHTGKRNLAYGFAAGVILNLGLMLLVAGISLVGMTLSFPMALGLGAVVSAVAVNLGGSQGRPVLVYAGAGAILVSVAFGLLAHRALSLREELLKMKAGEHRTLRPKVHWRGIWLSLAGGLVMGSVAPLLDMARQGELGIGPYTLGFLMCAGAFCSTPLFDLYFLNLPVRGQPIEPVAYLRGAWKQHLYGLLAGGLWAAGWIAWLVVKASEANGIEQTAVLSVAERSSPLLAAAWGIFAWREFRAADARVIAFLILMLAAFAAGVVLIGMGALTQPA